MTCLAFMLVGFGPPWAAASPSSVAVDDGATCALDPDDPEPPAYYAIDLVPTKRVPGTYRATGIGHVTFETSPFGIAISSEGHYVYDLSIKVDRMKPATKGAYVAWVSTPNLDEVKRIGPLGDDLQVTGQVDWNKFLVIITLEPSADAAGDMWSGPVVLRGMSRSGLMHTMAGHGPFASEPCASFGY